MNRLREIRESKALTQQELAHSSSVGVSTIQYIERGVSVVPRLDTARALAAALGVAIEEIWPATTQDESSKTQVR